jgi:hypothetical protein
MMQKLLLFSMLALVIADPSATPAEESAADILRSLNRAPAAAPPANASRPEPGPGAAGAMGTIAAPGVPAGNGPTPDQVAARYISDVVDPKIKTALAALPENERAAMAARFDAFKIELRRAIADYEKVEVTPEKAEAILRADHVKPELIAYFAAQAAGYKSRVSDPVEVIRLAYLDMAERRDGRLMVSEAVVDDYFRRGVYKSEHNELTEEQRAQTVASVGLKSGDLSNVTLLDYLLKAGAPGGLKFASYGRLRQEIILSITDQ